MNSRVLISLEEVSLRFGGKPLFEDVSLFVQERDKICLIGRNGAGKTTLMRLLAGELEIDSGRYFTYPGIRIGYLAQNVPFEAAHTVRDFVLQGLLPEQRDEAHLHLAVMVMEPLGLNADAQMGTLSGGQLRRAALAQALVSEPDVLLLDEPTNHLDLQAIEWLEHYLASYRGALVLVSHDRAFLKAVSRKVFWIDRGTIRTCPKGYSDFDEWMEQMLEQEAREIHNMEKKLAAEVDWTQGGVTGRRKRNIRRLRELNSLRAKLISSKSSHQSAIRTLSLDPIEPARASKIALEFRNVSHHFERDGKKLPILSNFHLRLMRGERIGILGKNGSGKSTFLKLLVGELEALGGQVWRGKNLEIAYFDQHRSDLKLHKTLWETLCPDEGQYVFIGSGEHRRPRHVCAYLKDFLFDPKAAQDKVSTLSGGMQNRLMLAKTLLNPGNLLILDEPTNDLDMDTLDMLQEIIADYQGTLLIVSHDRDFLDRTVTKILAFEGESQIDLYLGGYSDYLAAKRPPSKAQATAKAVPVKETEVAKPKPIKVSFKLQHEYETLPAQIAALEKERDEARALLADADLYIRDPQGFDKASRSLARTDAAIEKAESRWLELAALIEGTAA